MVHRGVREPRTQCEGGSVSIERASPRSASLERCSCRPLPCARPIKTGGGRTTRGVLPAPAISRRRRSPGRTSRGSRSRGPIPTARPTRIRSSAVDVSAARRHHPRRPLDVPGRRAAICARRRVRRHAAGGPVAGTGGSHSADRVHRFCVAGMRRQGTERTETTDSKNGATEQTKRPKNTMGFTEYFDAPFSSLTPLLRF